MSYYDKISSQLADKLSAHGLVSDNARSKSIWEKLKPPLKVRQKLSVLNGLCTYKLLDDIRFGAHKPVEWDQGQVSVTVADWYGQLREASSEWSYRPQNADKLQCETLEREGMLSHQWKNMGEELLALDRAIKVPREAPEMQRIYNAVKAVPEYIADDLRRAVPDDDIALVPIGSFQSGAKILDVNEFDFVYLSSRVPEITKQLTINFLNGYRSIIAQNRAAIRTSKMPAEPCIFDVYSHGPATCAELGWTCTYGHKHSIGIDMTFALRVTFSDLLSRITYSRPSTIFDKFVAEISTEMATLAGSTATLDKYMIGKLGEVHANIPAAYRLLKFFNRALLPNMISCSSQTIEPLVSPHDLKQLLYKHASLHPNPADWTTEKLSARICDMLQDMIKSNFVIESFFRHEWWPSAVSYKSALRKRVHNHLQNQLNTFVMFFQNDNTSVYSHELEVKRDCTKCGMLQLDHCGVFHKYSANDDGMNTALEGSVVHELTYAPMLLTTHPIVAWCQSQLLKLYEENPGIHTCTSDEGVESLSLAVQCLIQSYLHEISIKGSKSETAIKELISIFSPKKPVSFLMLTSSGLRNLVILKHLADAFPDIIRGGVLEEISRLMGMLSHRERALLYIWCKEVFEWGHSRPSNHLSNNYYTAKGISRQLKRILECLEYVEVTYHRTISLRSPSQLTLLGVFVKHFIADRDFLSDVKQDDFSWADSINQREMPLLRSNKITGYTIVYVDRDGKSLFRSIATLYNLLRGESLATIYNSGVLVCNNSFKEGNRDLEEYKLIVFNLFIHILKTTQSGDVDQNVLQLLHERIEELLKPWYICSLIEVVAMAFIKQTQIHLYEEKDDELVKTRSVPETLFSDQPPITLLFSSDRPPEHGQFNIVHFADHPWEQRIIDDRTEGVGFFDILKDCGKSLLNRLPVPD